MEPLAWNFPRLDSPLPKLSSRNCTLCSRVIAPWLRGSFLTQCLLSLLCSCILALPLSLLVLACVISPLIKPWFSAASRSIGHEGFLLHFPVCSLQCDRPLLGLSTRWNGSHNWLFPRLGSLLLSTLVWVHCFHYQSYRWFRRFFSAYQSRLQLCDEPHWFNR